MKARFKKNPAVILELTGEEASLLKDVIGGLNAVEINRILNIVEGNYEKAEKVQQVFTVLRPLIK